MITFRRAVRDDLDRTIELIDACFPNNPKADPAVMRWQYWDNPFGDAIVWSAYEGDRLVGTCAALRFPAILGDQRVTAAIAVDAATAADVRGQGLFPTLYGKIIEDALGDDIPVMFAHPKNPDSTRPQLRLGLAPVAEATPAYVAPMPSAYGLPARGALRPLTRAWLPRPSPSLSAAVVDEPPEGLDALWRRWEPDYGVVHDSAWWRWRYARPGQTYTRIAVHDGGRLSAVAVGMVRELKGMPVLHVLDALADDTRSAQAALAGLAHALPDASAIAGIALDGSRLARLLRAARLVRVPKRLAPKVTFGVIDTADPFEGSPVLARAPWQLSWCDLDHL